MQGGWPGPCAAGEHLLAAAAAQAVLLLDLRRPALPLLTWPHGARPVSRAPLEGCPPGAHERCARSLRHAAQRIACMTAFSLRPAWCFHRLARR
jgi:hypothetical protein